MGSLTELLSASEDLLDAATAAVALASNDDTTQVCTQARDAAALARGIVLEDAVAALKSLHDLNNRLTGTLAFATLAREDLGEASPADAALALVEARARTAARIVKELSASLELGR